MFGDDETRALYTNKQMGYFLSIGSMALMISAVLQLLYVCLMMLLPSSWFNRWDGGFGFENYGLTGMYDTVAIVSILAFVLGMMGRSQADESPRAQFCAGFGIGGAVLTLVLLSCRLLF